MKYRYYYCVTQHLHGSCKKKPIRKEFIENLIISVVVSILTDNYIDAIANRVSDLSNKESNTEIIKRLRRLLKENEEATTNLIKAIESGQAIDVITSQIAKRQSEEAELEAQLAQEMTTRPILTFDEVKFFFEKFKGGDINDISYRTSLIDTLVNKICLYDGSEPYAEIYCNANEKGIRITLDKFDKNLYMEQLVPLVRVELTTHGLGNHCSIH